MRNLKMSYDFTKWWSGLTSHLNEDEMPDDTAKSCAKMAWCHQHGKIWHLEQKVNKAVEALEHYGKGNAFGEVARQALEEIKGSDE